MQISKGLAVMVFDCCLAFLALETFHGKTWLVLGEHSSSADCSGQKPQHGPCFKQPELYMVAVNDQLKKCK